jgi:hypothetical protein
MSSKYSNTDQVLNSITNPDAKDVQDSTKPFTLIEWIDKTQNTPGSADNYIDIYNDYLTLWRRKTNLSTNDAQESIRDTYTNFLKEITLKYTSDDERRYLNNIDFTNKNELDAALPFYANRIKEIVELIYKNRQQLKFQKIKFSFKGSKIGLEKAIFDMLVKFISGEKLVNDKLTDINEFVRNTRIIINEKYDTSQSYFDNSFNYTTGGEYIDVNGNSYIGYYHVAYFEDGSKYYMSDKRTTDDSVLLTELVIGSVYDCLPVDDTIDDAIPEEEVEPDPEHPCIKDGYLHFKDINNYSDW